MPASIKMLSIRQAYADIMHFPRLNIPLQTIETKEANGKIWLKDVLRKKWLVARPEEWVRQQLLAHMIFDLGYPRQYMRIEGKIMVEKIPMRYDMALFDTSGRYRLIVECKAPNTTINDNILRQSSGYLHYSGAKALLITNGTTHIFMLSTNEGLKTSSHLLSYNEIEDYL